MDDDECLCRASSQDNNAPRQLPGESGRSNKHLSTNNQKYILRRRGTAPGFSLLFDTLPVCFKTLQKNQL
jgi:hypothetical protein